MKLRQTKTQVHNRFWNVRLRCYMHENDISIHENEHHAPKNFIHGTLIHETFEAKCIFMIGFISIHIMHESFFSFIEI